MADPCRICLGSNFIINMNDTFVGGRSICTIFTECLGLKLDTDTPASLCETCKLKLLEFNGFKQLAVLNSEFFLTKTIKTEFETNIFDEQCFVINPEVKIEDDLINADNYELNDDNYEVHDDDDDTEDFNEPSTSKASRPKTVRGKYKKKIKGTLESEAISDEMIRCPHCPRFFEGPSQVRRHMKQHEIEAGGLVCHFCDKVYGNRHANNRNLLRMHIKSVHLKDPNERFECDICGAQFSQKGSINVHKKFVHERKRGDFICHICSKAFRDKYKLTTHVRVTHDKILLHKCPECGKSFGNNTAVKNHIITVHSAEKMFTCQFCGKKFASASNKITHESK